MNAHKALMISAFCGSMAACSSNNVGNDINDTVSFDAVLLDIVTGDSADSAPRQIDELQFDFNQEPNAFSELFPES